MWGSNALRSIILPMGSGNRPPWLGDLAIPFQRFYVGFTALAVPPTATDIPPNASAGRRSLSMDTKTMDHIPVLNCRMQDVEEGGIESLFAFFSCTACPTMHSISFT